MANYEKSVGVSGDWVKGSEVVSGTKCKLVSETNPTQSQFKDEKTGAIKTQNVSKIVFATSPSNQLNINVNRATINALVDAFGGESKDWIGKVLTAQTEKVVVGGKRVTAVYLVPDGYALGEDSNGYVVISKLGEKIETIQLDPEMNDVKVEDIPF